MSVTVLAATGTYAAWRGVGTVHALFTTTYGLLVVAKVVLFAGIVVLANLSRQNVGRRRRAEPGAVDAVGTELLHRLASDPLSALLPKIVLSEDSDPRVHLRLRAAGAHQVAGLPLDVKAFVDAVGELLRRSTP